MQVSLEFFQRKRKWFGNEEIPWEIWTFRTEIVNCPTESKRLDNKFQLGETLAEKIRYIAEMMNKRGFVPKIPNKVRH